MTWARRRGLLACAHAQVSKTGGHLSSSLGVVELTVALHYVFNTPEDKIIWDVGHQVRSSWAQGERAGGARAAVQEEGARAAWPWRGRCGPRAGQRAPRRLGTRGNPSVRAATVAHLWHPTTQAYVHKILTGRRSRMHTIRTTNGLSGARQEGSSVARLPAPSALGLLASACTSPPAHLAHEGA